MDVTAAHMTFSKWAIYTYMHAVIASCTKKLKMHVLQHASSPMQAWLEEVCLSAFFPSASSALMTSLAEATEGALTEASALWHCLSSRVPSPRPLLE
jgi:hypothetical protein